MEYSEPGDRLYKKNFIKSLQEVSDKYLTKKTQQQICKPNQANNGLTKSKTLKLNENPSTM